MKYAIMLALRAVTDNQLAEVAVRLADIPAVTSDFERILLEVMQNAPPVPIADRISFQVPISKTLVTFSKAELEQIKKLAEGGNKVGGIKLIREVTFIGLKEAKDLWEDMEDKKLFALNRSAY